MKTPVEVLVKCIPPELSFVPWNTALKVIVRVPLTPVHGFVVGNVCVVLWRWNVTLLAAYAGVASTIRESRASAVIA